MYATYIGFYRFLASVGKGAIPQFSYFPHRSHFIHCMSFSTIRRSHFNDFRIITANSYSEQNNFNNSGGSQIILTIRRKPGTIMFVRVLHSLGKKYRNNNKNIVTVIVIKIMKKSFFFI